MIPNSNTSKRSQPTTRRFILKSKWYWDKTSLNLWEKCWRNIKKYHQLSVLLNLLGSITLEQSLTYNWSKFLVKLKKKQSLTSFVHQKSVKLMSRSRDFVESFIQLIIILFFIAKLVWYFAPFFFFWFHGIPMIYWQ